MSLQFLSPNWFWALSLIIIPIIVHLFNFRRYKLVYFTNVHLLQEVKKDTQAKSKLKELLILLSRILLITFLVLAFSQPVWVDLDKQEQYKQESDLIIIVDNSFSMSSEGANGVLLEVAKQKAFEIINAYPQSTKIMLLSSDVQAKQLVYKSKEDIFTALSNIKISAFTYPLDHVVKMARIRMNKDIESHHLFLISDFQKSNYTPLSDLDSTFQTFLIPLKSQNTNNIIVDTVYFYSPIHSLNKEEKLIYSLTNNGKDEVVDFGVELYINDSLKSISNVDILSGESILDTFRYTNSTNGIQRGKISISDFPITYDNELFFNYNIKKETKVAICTDTKNPFLDAFFRNNKYYQVKEFSPENINSEYCKNSDVIIHTAGPATGIYSINWSNWCVIAGEPMEGIYFSYLQAAFGYAEILPYVFL
jgi:sulfur transfer complex TusBCD TusB component (DsrH family)